MKVKIILIWCLAIGVQNTNAQDLRAQITGNITDPSGGVIESAHVELIDIARGLHFSSASNSSGDYAIQFLPVGTYSLNVLAAGFKRYIADYVSLTTDARRIFDVTLQIGENTESVTVVGILNPVKTYAFSRGGTITGQLIVDLPNNGRNLYQLAWSAAGVTKASTYWGSMENYAVGNATNAYINGGIRRENETILDGVTNTGANRDVVFQPPVEATEEVRVQTSNYDASYGRLGGGVVAIVTKSGTNSYHGTLFETNKNAALAANPWVLNSLGEKQGRFGNNTFGLQTGGPARIPKLLDGRNRLFFMVAYEGLRESSSSNLSTRVATAEQRNGDFSAVPLTIYDPLTTHLENGQYVRTAFAGNRIPANRLNPVSQKVLSFLPLPNLRGRTFPLDNYASFSGDHNGYNQWLTKFDYRINATNNVYFSYGRLPYREYSDVLFGSHSPADTSNSNPLQRNFERWVADWTVAPSPRIAINLRVGLARSVITNWNSTATNFDPRQLGFSDALVSQFGFLQFPFFNLGGGYSAIGVDEVFSRDTHDSWSYQANISRTAGAHLLHAGAEFRIYNDNSRSPGRASGEYDFTKAFTQANPSRGDAASGDELASFLLGYPDGGAVDRNIDPAFQAKYWALFFQDTWRVSHKLTLNMGLRWDYERPAVERFNRMERGFAFEQPSPIVGNAQGPNLHGGLLFAAQRGEGRLAFAPDRNNWQPRIAVAYQIRSDWALRAGYGLFYLGVNGGQPTNGFSQQTDIVSTLDGGNTPRVTLANAFPEGILPAVSSLGMSTGLGQAVSFGYLNRVIPYSHQFSITLEHLLGRGVIVEASYSGNLTRRYPVTAQLNVLPVSELGRSDSYYRESVPNPMAGLLPLNASKNGATISRQDLLLPFPQYTTVTMSNIPLGRNDYHAFQLELRKRYSSGFSLNASYTLSKTLEQLSFLNQQDFNLQNINASRLEKRLAQFDVPQKLAVLATYELPIGPGKRWLVRHGLVERIAGGWQLNGDLTVQSGFPVDYPNAPQLFSGTARLPSSQVTLYRAFDTSLFPTIAPNLQYALRTFPTRFSDVRLRPLQDLDVSVSKTTRLTERLKLEVRVEFLNATNHPWFSKLNSRGTDVTRPEFGWYQLEEQNQNRLIALVGKVVW